MNKKPKINFLSQGLELRTHGFTLIEILIVFGILAATATVILSIIFVTLRVSKKSDLLLTIKQNGDNAMSQMVKGVRYAKSLDSACSATNAPIKITSLTDNTQTTFTCTTGSSGTISSTIAANTVSLIDTNTISVTNCSFTCFQATPSDPPTISIGFTLSSKNANSLVETTGTIPFQTSVTMRNFNN